MAVLVFLLIGVLRSVRPPDDTHPLGYGRERFFWSLFAALGIFLGGGVLGLEEAVRAAVHSSAVHSYPVAYLVLGTTIALDAFALEIALRPLREQAAGRGISLRSYLRRSTDPAPATVVVGQGCAVIGGVTAAAGLILAALRASGGYHLLLAALLWLTVEPAHLDQTGRAIARHPEVPFAAATTGHTNLLISARFRGTRHLYHYITARLTGLPGIRSLETSHIVGRFKQAGPATLGLSGSPGHPGQPAQSG